MRVIKPLLGFASLFVVVALLGYLIGHENITQASEKIESWSAVLTVIRLCVIGLVWLYWNKIVDRLYRGKNKKASDYLKSRRYFYTALLLAIEVLLVQNVVRSVLELF